MSNPYQTPDTIDELPARDWRNTLPQLFKPLWLLGTGLILASWLKLVGSVEGWIGFGITIVAVVLSFAFPKLYALRPRDWTKEKLDWTFFSAYILEERGETYQAVLAAFQNGYPLLFDGMLFALYPAGKISCAVIPPRQFHTQDNAMAAHVFQQAEKTFGLLTDKSPEFASIVSNRGLSVWLVSAFSPSGTIFCHVEEGNTHWDADFANSLVDS